MPWHAQLDFGAVVEALSAQGYGDDKLEQLVAQLGFADSVTVEQLAAAGVPNRTVFDVRRRLDPVVIAAEVRTIGECKGGGTAEVEVCLPLVVVVGVQGVCVRLCVCVCVLMAYVRAFGSVCLL